MMTLDLTLVIPARNEAENLRQLLPKLHRAARGLGASYEILVVDGHSTDDTAAAARDLGAMAVGQSQPGYGGALLEGFRRARGRYIVTLDADLSHEPDFLHKLWAHRDEAELIIASRYVRGGVAYMPLFRKVLSRVLNRLFTWGLAMDVRDISSGFRLYRAEMIKQLPLHGVLFDILPEIAVRAHIDGWRILEVPFTYYPRVAGSSQARIIRVGVHLMKTFRRLWGLRSSIAAADYDERAFYSRIPLQRYWHRKRHEIITSFAREGGRTLDVGCGSSVILQSLNHAIGLEIRHVKMRYMRRYGMPLVTGSVLALPFKDQSMDCVICSEVIEHLPAGPEIFQELDRVLRPGGWLILGTPDYGSWKWPTIEWFYGTLAPWAYACEHMSHFTRDGLTRILEAMGYEAIRMRDILGSDLFVAAKKSGRPFTLDAIRPWLPATTRSAFAPSRARARAAAPSARSIR